MKDGSDHLSGHDTWEELFLLRLNVSGIAHDTSLHSRQKRDFGIGCLIKRASQG